MVLLTRIIIEFGEFVCFRLMMDSSIFLIYFKHTIYLKEQKRIDAKGHFLKELLGEAVWHQKFVQFCPTFSSCLEGRGQKCATFDAIWHMALPSNSEKMAFNHMKLGWWDCSKTTTAKI